MVRVKMFQVERNGLTFSGIKKQRGNAVLKFLAEIETILAGTGRRR